MIDQRSFTHVICLDFYPKTNCDTIGTFTVTSHAVSRGRLASLVGKRFAAGGLRVYFAGIHSLFAFILLTYKIMIMFCICAGYIGHCVDGSFYFLSSKKGKTKKTLVECVQL